MTVAETVAALLAARGVERLFALCGGHIMPIWMAADAAGVRIVDTRDERAAVHMAQAQAEVAGGFGVAMVTAGPGVSNAMTGIANAHVSRAPVLVLSGVPPTPQEGRGALQDIDHLALVGSVTRFARTVRDPAAVARTLDEALARALGEGGEPGPVFVQFPTDLLRAEAPAATRGAEYLAPRPRPRAAPDPHAVERAVDLLWSARRPLVISGRGARGAGPQMLALLDRLGCAGLDTGESRGLVPDDHPGAVAAMRGAAMREADLIVAVGRRLDFQLAYGSPAVFGDARFVRIADTAAELRDNRRGEVEIFADPALALEAMLEAAGNRAPQVDGEWMARLRRGHRERAARLRREMAEAPPGSDGRMHPLRLVGALRGCLEGEAGDGAVLVVDGGDFLSFARIGLSASTVLDPGAFGCIGVGVPYGVAAALARPGRRVAVATGDGAFGFNAIDIDTAARHGAGVVFVVANNGAWQIEVHDQMERYGRTVGARLQFADYAAMARGFGLHAERVEDPEALPDALERAFAAAPALLDVPVTPEAASPDARSGLAQVPDLQPLVAWDAAERSRRAGA